MFIRTMLSKLYRYLLASPFCKYLKNSLLGSRTKRSLLLQTLAISINASIKFIELWISIICGGVLSRRLCISNASTARFPVRFRLQDYCISIRLGSYRKRLLFPFCAILSSLNLSFRVHPLIHCGRNLRRQINLFHPNIYNFDPIDSS